MAVKQESVDEWVNEFLTTALSVKIITYLAYMLGLTFHDFCIDDTLTTEDIMSMILSSSHQPEISGFSYDTLYPLVNNIIKKLGDIIQIEVHKQYLYSK